MFDTVGHTLSFVNYMLSQELSQSCSHQPGRLHVCAMDTHVTQSLLHSREVTQHSFTLTSGFREHKQEDALEFLMFSLNVRHTSCLPVSQHWGPASEGRTLGHEMMLGGSWGSQTKCLLCGGTSGTFDPFLDIKLAPSVNRALEDLVKVKELGRVEEMTRHGPTWAGSQDSDCANCFEGSPAGVESPLRLHR